MLSQTLGKSLLKCNMPIGPNGPKGYGFAVVQEQDLDASLQKLNSVICDGFKWQAAESIQRRNNQRDSAEELDTTKLIIKNLAFQASPVELK